MKIIDVVLSDCVVAGGCGWHVSSSVRHIAVESLPLSNSDAISHSAAEATLLLSILHRMCADPFIFGWVFSISLVKLIIN